MGDLVRNPGLFVPRRFLKVKNMAKKIEGYIKLEIPAGGANPSPPVVPRWDSVVSILWNSVKLLTRLLKT